MPLSGAHAPKTSNWTREPPERREASTPKGRAIIVLTPIESR